MPYDSKKTIIKTCKKCPNVFTTEYKLKNICTECLKRPKTKTYNIKKFFKLKKKN